MILLSEQFNKQGESKMKHFDVWFAGMVIGDVRADTLIKARNLAKKLWSGPIVVTASDASEDEINIARITSKLNAVEFGS